MKHPPTVKTPLIARCGAYKAGSYRGFTEEGLAKHEAECEECRRLLRMSRNNTVACGVEKGGQ